MAHDHGSMAPDALKHRYAWHVRGVWCEGSRKISDNSGYEE